VEGIEEYVKVLQPVSVLQTAVKPVNEEQKQESPLPRGRRVTAQSSEPIEAEEDKENDAKRQSNKEGVQVPGVGRRGASRRARPVPAVPQTLGKAVAEEDGQGEQNLKQEAKRDSAPAPVVGRLARPSTVVIARADESEVAGVEEEQSKEVVDDALALGVGRRGASRRARPAPSIAALAGNVVEDEEQIVPIPRGRRVKAHGNSSEPIRLDTSYDDEKEEAKPVEEQDDAQIVGVGRRRGASRRAQAASAIAAPEAKTEEEQKAPITRGRRVKAKSTELIRLDDSSMEKKEDPKPEEETGDAPAVGAERRAPSPSKAPATRRSGAASKAEAGDVAVEVVSSLATRQRKTMKAAAAAAEAEEKAPRRATRRGAVTSTLMQQELQEKPQEAIGATDEAARALPIRPTRQRKPTMKAAAAATAQEKAPIATRRGALMTLLQQDVQEEPKEAVGAPVSHQRCDALEETKEAFVPQKEEINELDAPKQDEDEDMVIIDGEKLMEETPAEDPPVTDQERTGKSEFQEQQVDDEEKCLATLEEPPIIGLVSMVTEQPSEDDGGVNFQDGGGSSAALLDKNAGEEIELVAGVRALQVPLTGNGSDASHESEMRKFNEVLTVREKNSEVDTQEVSKEMEHTDIAELQADIVDEAAFLDCSSIVNLVAGEETEVVNTEDGLGCEEDGDVDKVLHDSVDDTILIDCSSENVEMEKAGNVTREMPENQAALDEDVGKPNEVVIGDKPQDTVTDKVVQEGREVLITDEMQQGTAGMHDEIEDDQFESVFVQADQVVTADNLLEQVTDREITVEENTALIVGERQQSTVTMDEDVVEDHSDTDGDHSNEHIEAVTTVKVPELKLIEDIFVQSDHAVAADNLPEQVRDCGITMETTSLIVDEKQQIMVTVDGDLVMDGSETDNVHPDEQMEVVTAEEVLEDTGITVEDVEEKQKSTVTVDKDVVDDHFFKTDDVHADEQMEASTTDEVPELTEADYEVVEEKQQSTYTMNGGIEDDHFKTHVAHADEKKEVVATDVPEVTGTVGEIEEKTSVTMDGDVVFDHADGQKEVIVTEVPDEVTVTGDEGVERKAAVITEAIPDHGTAPSIAHTMNGCVKETHFGDGNEQKKVITADIISIPQDDCVRKENASSIDVAESLSSNKSSGCKNSSEKNTTEPMAVLKDKGLKATKKPVDLLALSLGKLKAKLKDRLNAEK
ncbi:hypothetical protein ACJX0J_041180, partial [Zea mays]